jgi:hypothetical protein
MDFVEDEKIRALIPSPGSDHLPVFAGVEIQVFMVFKESARKRCLADLARAGKENDFFL